MPLGFIDVGVRGGTHELVDPVARATAVLGFEPDPQECVRLLSMPEVNSPWARFELEPFALAESERDATMHLLEAATNNSLLAPNEAFTHRYRMHKWEMTGAEPVSARALDEVIFSPERAQEPFWGECLKLDIQGTEYEVLRGASRTLAERTLGLVVEVSFAELYRGQKLFSEVEQLLRSHGFTFYGFSHGPHTRSRKLLDKRVSATAERIMYADAVFFKDPLPGTPYSQMSAIGGGEPFTARQNAVLFTLALLLNYFDFALELAEESWLTHSDESERARIRRLVAEISAMPQTRTRGELSDLAGRVEQQPDLANLLVGDFVDRRRRLCNYDDVLGISALPRTL